MTVSFRLPTRIALAGLAVCGLAAIAAPASAQPQRDENIVAGAVQQPFRDLNLIRETAPPQLVAAAQAPYADATADCAALRSEIASLDTLLGPDVDDKTSEENSAARDLAAGALRSALDLPFRSVIRRVTGAHSRDEAIRRAVLAGMVRRAYLKGVYSERRCDAPPPATTVELPQDQLELSDPVVSAVAHEPAFFPR